MRKTTNVVMVLSLPLVLGLTACDPELAPEPTPDTEPAPAPLDAGTNELDVLLVVDDSYSMARKQHQLALALEQFTREVVNPPCIDASGTIVALPSSPTDACPANSERASTPELDLHVGVITSDLGCFRDEALHPPRNAHLVGTGVPSEGGVLAWSPSTGESIEAFAARVNAVVLGIGEPGCGYEAPLEAMYRFLVDPAPFATRELVGGVPVLSGVDDALLAERAAFLRPDSALAVVLLSDENDCSFDAASQFDALTTPGAFYKATSACDADPSDACCTSCGLPIPEGCAPDVARCGPDQGTALAARYDAVSDHPNLACFDQKRRFGIDFLHPTSRYVDALTSPTLVDRAGAPFDNPLFANGRPESRVFFTSIVGVPWQDIAVDPSAIEAGLRNAAELEASGQMAWILGDSASNEPPIDPLMHESIAPRTGTQPVNGEPLVAPGNAPTQLNGSEHESLGELQYACIFELPAPLVGCSETLGTCCEGQEPSPLCSTTELETQLYAEAMPGTRHLEVARGLGERGILGSVCAPEHQDTPPIGQAMPARGYFQPMRGLLRALRPILRVD
jgi:hypothetical protein